MNKTTNFKKTLEELKKFSEMPVVNDRDRAGIIQAFEFTFEQAWKCIQKISTAQGLEIGSPRKAFVAAMQNGWIAESDEGMWLEMIKDRNLTTHTYEQALAKLILARIQSNYIRMFESLLTKLQAEN